MVEQLKKEVYEANLELVKSGLVIFTWGNASAVNRDVGIVVIKPSGVDYSVMKASDMVVCDMDGKVIEGRLKPSSDLPTHLYLYKHFKEAGGVVHTHSTYASAWAQAGLDIPVAGTTHADYFAGDIPCTRQMTEEEISGDYESETGKVIVERFSEINPFDIPGVLVCNHGPFTWGENINDAVFKSVVLEQVAKMAAISFALNPKLIMNPYLSEKHYNRKHGSGAYYGQ